MIPTEKLSNPKRANAKPKKSKHRQRKKVYLQSVIIGVPKQPLRSHYPAPTHEQLSDWKAAS